MPPHMLLYNSVWNIVYWLLKIVSKILCHKHTTKYWHILVGGKEGKVGLHKCVGENEVFWFQQNLVFLLVCSCDSICWTLCCKGRGNWIQIFGVEVPRKDGRKTHEFCAVFVYKTLCGFKLQQCVWIKQVGTTTSSRNYDVLRGTGCVEVNMRYRCWQEKRWESDGCEIITTPRIGIQVSLRVGTLWLEIFNPLQTERRPLYLKTQSVPRCKHFSARL